MCDRCRTTCAKNILTSIVLTRELEGKIGTASLSPSSTSSSSYSSPVLLPALLLSGLLNVFSGGHLVHLASALFSSFSASSREDNIPPLQLSSPTHSTFSPAPSPSQTWGIEELDDSLDNLIRSHLKSSIKSDSETGKRRNGRCHRRSCPS